ncbi:Glycogen debranching enzyme (alpha-1,6-glucosidase) [Fictibacillus enclensis]|uniref:Amylo-alpha-1,6-glucosidase n=1 Tax=Fictibacillus enclensis TaxID=1017270 RepID=A0A0V8J938_9BACL|nr:amylo-alpha-1,6-glucosidase [Fictibacillus enclensis]KSU83483.1 amylo-alpha-1,6-glucosidase [Fictibacillus enclensis]SCC16199.1 Glycogen debranching enzyme (alpha-1,6-glucosidase) [Fictibacillus enclensis]
MDYRVIKENDLFLLTDDKGNIPLNNDYGLGLYTKDTRFLSKFDLKINNEDPILLSSSADENYSANILMTNPHMEKDGELILWRESVEIQRKRLIYDGVLYETVQVKSFYPKPVEFDISMQLDVDFTDMFIVRGFQSGETGKRTGIDHTDKSLTYHYEGADGVKRSTRVGWDREAINTSDAEVAFHFSLDHEEIQSVTFTIAPEVDGVSGEIMAPEQALENLKASYENWEKNTARVQTDSSRLQRLVDRGILDLRVLMTDIGYGQFPVAGLPWFGVPFGRDSLIAALQMLPFNAEIAKGTLRTLASQQGTKVDPWRDEQPGKIMHEIRYGELAGTEQIPFTPYYGTIDATPLFLMLLTEYTKWTGDLSLAEELQQTIENALMWIDEYGDRDGDGFVEYHQESSKGIANQGWKDSADSVVHRNGDHAETPIALSEVQGYVYQAKTGIAAIYEKQGKAEEAVRLLKEAEELKSKFHEQFWMEDQSFYAIALDKEKKKVGTLTSNPGHVLYSGMLEEEQADQTVSKLVSPAFFSGYGIRTMAEGEAGYNPMSYHDGSIWPHDNSMILLGMSKLNHQKQANQVINGLMDAAQHFEYDRLPELFCGYGASGGPAVKYPVACSPQAWAAGTPLVFIQTVLGLFPDALNEVISVSPELPEGVNELTVQSIKIGNGYLSVSVRKENGKSFLTVNENTTGYTIHTDK